MTLQEFCAIVRKHAILVSSAVAAGLVSATIVCLVLPPSYSSETKLVVTAQQSGDTTASDLVQGSDYAHKQLATYLQLVDQPIVLQPVIDGLKLPVDPATLADHVSADNPTRTSLVAIVASWNDAHTAAKIANATAASLTNAVEAMETPPGSSSPQVKVTAASTALVPTSAATPNILWAIVVGLLGGLALGLAGAVLRETLSTRVRTPDDIAALTDVAVIGSIPQTSRHDQSALIVDAPQFSALAEAFRKLRTNLRFVEVDHAPRSIVMTSSIPSEAKTSSSINLAFAIAATGRRVCLVDADLRRPKIATYLGIEGSIGLTSVLLNEAEIPDVTQHVGGAGGIDVLTSGRIPPNPAEWLNTKAIKYLFSALQNEYDLVIIDSPPLLPVTDAAILSTIADGTILVVGADKVHKAELRHSLESLAAVRTNPLGIVMTFTRAERGSYAQRSYESEGATAFEGAVPLDGSGPRQGRATAPNNPPHVSPGPPRARSGASRLTRLR